MNYILISLSISWVALTGCTSLNHQNSPNKTNQVQISQGQISKDPYVVLISIDGYRSDYTDLYSPPALTRFKNEGTAAKGLIPIFPSKTYTNHYSIVTGLYSENHGIVANHFFDPIRKEEYRLTNRKSVEDPSWYGGTPLWVAAEQQGMLTAVYFWPGSETAIQGVRPKYYFNYDAKVAPEERVAQVRRWLDLPSDIRPHFIAVYFSDVDTAGHLYGPRSTEVKNAVLKTDQNLAVLLKDLESRPFPINVVILSDHGMQQLDSNKVEYLDDYADLSPVRILGDGPSGNGPQMLLYSEDSKALASIYGKLKRKGKHFNIFKREEAPPHYHCKTNRRCGDLVVVAKAPYLLGIRSSNSKVTAGNHGYDPATTPAMQGVFYAKGPHIQRSRTVEAFENIHVYPFIVNLLGLKLPTPIDANLDVLRAIYVDP